MNRINTPDSLGAAIVSSKTELQEFLDFPYNHYASDSAWVPPLKLLQSHAVDTRNNPFYNHAEIALFTARYNGRVSGRIAAIDNKAYTEYTGSDTGFFGFFDSIDHHETANLLFKVAGDWLKQRGLSNMIGPVNPSMLDEIGVLVDGFDIKPSIMMPYSKPYYDKLIKGAGLKKSVDLYAYRVTKDTVSLDRVDRAEQIVNTRTPGVTIRKINPRYLKREIGIIHKVFNKAWAQNWGFSEISYDEFYDLGKGLKKFIDTDVAHIAELDGEPIGFSIALPDLNQALQHMNGSLWPTGIFKFLYHKRNINSIRTALMGVIPEYQKRGIDVLLYGQAIRSGLKKGYIQAEMSWLLENNPDMLSVAHKVGGSHEKTYRLYET